MFESDMADRKGNEALGDVLRRARKRRGMTLRAIADAMTVSPQAVGQWERADNDISMDNLRALAQLLGIDPLAADKGTLVYVGADASVVLTEAEAVSEPGTPVLGPRSIPVLGVTVGGDGTDFYMNGDIIDYARRPPGAEHMTNIFALHVLGESMSPRYDPGDMVYCGGRPPVKGDYVVIEMLPASGERAGKCFIKRLLVRREGKLICEQFNPPKSLEFDANNVKAVHRIIPLKELMGL